MTINMYVRESNNKRAKKTLLGIFTSLDWALFICSTIFASVVTEGQDDRRSPAQLKDKSRNKR